MLSIVCEIVVVSVCVCEVSVKLLYVKFVCVKLVYVKFVCVKLLLYVSVNCMYEGGGGRRRSPGYRIKNKNPTQRCGEKEMLKVQLFFPSTICILL